MRREITRNHDRRAAGWGCGFLPWRRALACETLGMCRGLGMNKSGLRRRLRAPRPPSASRQPSVGALRYVSVCPLPVESVAVVPLLSFSRQYAAGVVASTALA